MWVNNTVCDECKISLSTTSVHFSFMYSTVFHSCNFFHPFSHECKIMNHKASLKLICWDKFSAVLLPIYQMDLMKILVLFIKGNGFLISLHVHLSLLIWHDVQDYKIYVWLLFLYPWEYSVFNCMFPGFMHLVMISNAAHNLQGELIKKWTLGGNNDLLSHTDTPAQH